MRWPILALSFLLACGASEPRPEAPAPVSREPVAESEPAAPRSQAAIEEPTTPLELLWLLQDIARGSAPGRLEDYVDQAFAARMPSTDDLAGLFHGWPESCEPEPQENAGEALNTPLIPEPVDDPPEEAARVEAIIEELSVSTIVSLVCTELTDPSNPAWALTLLEIAIRPDSQGRYRVLAWRGGRSAPPSRP